jgi:hypothetical protein
MTSIKQQLSSCGCLVFLAFASAVIAAICGNTEQPHAGFVGPEQPSVPAIIATQDVTRPTGGLCDATMGDWRQARYEDKLAATTELVVFLLQQNGANIAALEGRGLIRPAVTSVIEQLDTFGPDQIGDDVTVLSRVTAIYVATKKSMPESSFVVGSPVRKWYEGGTLHNAKMRTWRRASYENKLATAADFVTALLIASGVNSAKIDIEGLVRPAAIGFVQSLDAAADGGYADDFNVPEVAATILALIQADLKSM